MVRMSNAEKNIIKKTLQLHCSPFKSLLPPWFLVCERKVGGGGGAGNFYTIALFISWVTSINNNRDSSRDGSPSSQKSELSIKLFLKISSSLKGSHIAHVWLFWEQSTPKLLDELFLHEVGHLFNSWWIYAYSFFLIYIPRDGIIFVLFLFLSLFFPLNHLLSHSSNKNDPTRGIKYYTVRKWPQ